MVTESDISRLNSEINAIRMENNQMESEISQMTNSLSNALNNVSNARSNAVGALESGNTTINAGDNTLKNVSVIADDIAEITKKFKIIENSYKEIRKLKNDLNSQLGNEKTVKRLVTAILDNEDNALAQEEIIDEQAEKLHIMTKDYFLSYVMMDLQLTKRGEAEAAKRARDMALELDARGSEWVYLLVALRRGDEKEQSFWLDKLSARPISGAEKEQLKLLTVLALTDSGSVSAKLKKFVGMADMKEIEGDKKAENILGKYREVMAVKAPEFRYLKECVAENSSLTEALRGAMNNEEIAAYVQQFTKRGQAEFRKEIILKLFDYVVENCNSPRSQEIYDKIAEHERIIEKKGNVEEAMALKAVQATQSKADVNLEECMFEWLDDGEIYAGKEALKSYSYSKYSRVYKRAYKKYVSEYRSKYSKNVTVSIGEYKTKTPLTDIEKEEGDIKAFCNNRRDAEKAAIKDTKFILCMVFGGLLLVAGIVLFCLSSVLGSTLSTAGLIVGELAGVVLLVLGVVFKYKNYKARIASDEKCARDICDYTEKMQYVYGDMQSYRDMYEQFDAKVISDGFFEN